MTKTNTGFAVFLVGLLGGFLSGCLVGSATPTTPTDDAATPIVVLEGSGDEFVDRAVERLQESASPILAPVYVEWVEGLVDRGRLGETQYDITTDTLTIRLQADLSVFSRERLERYVKMALLMHEWGHALSIGSGAVGDSSHDAMWGVGTSRAYRALYGRL